MRMNSANESIIIRVPAIFEMGGTKCPSFPVSQGHFDVTEGHSLLMHKILQNANFYLDFHGISTGSTQCVWKTEVFSHIS